MQILQDKEAQEALPWFDECARVAGTSICLRAHCGAVIVKNRQIISEGANSPPQNEARYRTCLNEYDIPAGFRHDRTCCIHAEQRAIANAYKEGKTEELKGSRIYFVRINEAGVKKKADALVCTICSRAVLDAGIAEFALYCVDGVRIYDAEEFNKLSYRYKTPQIDLPTLSSLEK